MPVVYRAFVATIAAMFLVVTAARADDDFPILGDWLVSNAVLAPWVKPSENTATYVAAGKAHLKLLVTFMPDKVVSTDTVIGCTDANYGRTLLPPAGLFQGSLPDPHQVEIARFSARAVGVSAADGGRADRLVGGRVADQGSPV